MYLQESSDFLLKLEKYSFLEENFENFHKLNSSLLRSRDFVFEAKKVDNQL